MIILINLKLQWLYYDNVHYIKLYNIIIDNE